MTNEEISQLANGLGEAIMAADKALQELRAKMREAGNRLGIPRDLSLLDIKYKDIHGEEMTARKVFAALRYGEAVKAVDDMAYKLTGVIADSVHQSVFDAIEAAAEEVRNA